MLFLTGTHQAIDAVKLLRTCVFPGNNISQHACLGSLVFGLLLWSNPPPAWWSSGNASQLLHPIGDLKTCLWKRIMMLPCQYSLICKQLLVLYITILTPLNADAVNGYSLIRQRFTEKTQLKQLACIIQYRLSYGVQQGFRLDRHPLLACFAPAKAIISHKN